MAVVTGCRGPSAGSGGRAGDAATDDRFADALSYFGQGVLAQSNDDLPAATSNFQAAVKLDPDHEELRFRLAMVLLQQRRADEAEAVLRDYLKRNEKSEKGWLWLALVQRSSDRDEEALETYERLRKVAPASASGYLEAAGLLTKMGRPDDGIDLLREAVKKPDPNTDAIRILGEIYVRRAATGSLSPADAKDIRSLIETIEEQLRATPKEEALLYQLGDLYILDQRIEDAILTFERIEELNPNDLRIKQKLAMSFVATGQRAKAIEALEAIAKKRPTNSRILYYLGELYEQEEDIERATFNYELAAKASPKDAAPYIKLALLNMEKNPEKAMAFLEEGMKAAPGEARIPEMLAYVRMSRKDHEGAVRAFEDVQRIVQDGASQPAMPSYVIHHALSLQHLGRIDDALAILRPAIAGNDRYLDAYVDLALRSRDRAPTESTLKILGTLAAEQPDDQQILIYIGAIHQSDESFAKALEYFEKAESVAATKQGEAGELSPQFYFWYGAAAERTGDLERADRIFRKCLELDPNHAEAMNYIAYMWAERGQKLEEGYELSKKSLEIEPENPAFIDTLGWIYFQKGETEKALKEILRAANLLPEDPTIVDHLGDIMERQGKMDRAIEYWKRSFILDPEQEKVAAKLEKQGIDLAPLREKAAEHAKARKEAEERGDAGDGTEP